MKIFLVLLAILSTFIACKKEDDNDLQRAIVMWHGPYELDGCEYFVEIDGTEFKPLNEEIFGDQFQNGESVEIEINYIETGNTDIPCGLMLHSYPSIRIYSFQEK